MKSTFNFLGYSIQIGGSQLGGDTELGMGAVSHVRPDHVVLQVFRHPYATPVAEGQPATIAAPADGFYVAGFDMEPSHARALASALLSAAIEARTP